MGTKTVAITDLHLELAFRTPRIENTLRSFAEEMEEVRPDLLLVLGDIFNVKKPSGSTVEFATQFFSSLSKSCTDIILITGGHDQDAHKDITACDFLDDMVENIELVREPRLVSDIMFLPYQRRLQPETLEQLLSANMAFMHQGISEAPLDHGARLYGNKLDAVPLQYLTHMQLVICGHIHTPWQYENIYVLGSPYQTRMNHPIVDRSYALFTLENPSDLALMPFPNTFYLYKETVELEEKASIESLTSVLPILEDNVFYHITVALSGPKKTNRKEGVKQLVRSIYGPQLDDVQIVYVLPKKARTVLGSVKLAAKATVGKSPEEMLHVWMDTKNPAYFNGVPGLRDGMALEFRDIVQAVESNNTRR